MKKIAKILKTAVQSLAIFPIIGERMFRGKWRSILEWTLIALVCIGLVAFVAGFVTKAYADMTSWLNMLGII